MAWLLSMKVAMLADDCNFPGSMLTRPPAAGAVATGTVHNHLKD
jgi:hypothetical protein